MEQFLVIRDEREDFINFERNEVQVNLSGIRTNRDIVVKPRKIGFTTDWLMEQYLRCITTPGWQALAFTYDDEEAEAMFAIVKRAHDNMSKGMHPKLGIDKGTAFSFPNLDSGIQIQSAGGRRKGRGRTPSAILLDEFAHYDANAAIQIFSSVVNSAPIWASVRIQSTPFGIGNQFHRLFTRAEEGLSPFKAIFYPWMFLNGKHTLAHDDEAIVQAAIPDLQGDLQLTDEEINLLTRWNESHPPDAHLDQDNIRWRRYKILEDPDTFKQEYPEDSVTCFMATTDSVFDVDKVAQLMQSKRGPTREEFNGDQRIFKAPQPGMSYVIGVDNGEGIKGADNSVAHVMTGYGETVMVHAGIYSQSEMAQIVHDIGREYFDAFVLNERQAGHTFQNELHHMGYKNIYRHVDPGTEKSRSITKPPMGFPTTIWSKRDLISGMRNALASDSFICPDAETLREIVEYQRHAGGEYAAPVGGHDDRAMAAMLAVYALGVDQRAPQRVKRRAGGRRSTKYPPGAME